MLFLEQTHGFGIEEGHAPPPSLFELLMQQKLNTSFKPAAEYLLHAVCEAYPDVAQSIGVRYFDELYAFLHAMLERHFLTSYDSLATEKFFGMKRALVSDDKTTKTLPLTSSARRRSLLYAVLLPYMKSKVDNYHRDLVESPPRPDVANTESSQSMGGMQKFLRHLQRLQVLYKTKRGFVKVYPFIHFAYEGVFFLYQWLYLFEDTPYFTPILRRLKVVLVRATMEDETAFQDSARAARAEVLKRWGGPSLLHRLQRGLRQSVWAVQDHSYLVLLFGIAGYKLVEWMYSDEGVAAKKRMNAVDTPVPPPPLPPQFTSQQLGHEPVDAGFCPICRRPRVNPAMASSGYVFCYTCIYEHLSNAGTCPVTNMKCDKEALVRIYDEHAEDAPVV